MSADSIGDALPKLDRLSKIRPKRVSRLIRLLWPDIEAALEFGHTLRFIHERLRESGVSITYNQLTVYISRLRRAGPTKKTKRNKPHPEIRESELSETGAGDPLDNYRERCVRNPPSFRIESGEPDKSKLI